MITRPLINNCKIAVFLFLLICSSILVFPVNAQNTIILNPTTVTTISNSSIDNYPINITGFKVGNENGTIWKTYLMFDLSSIPQNAKIENATLSLKDETWLVAQNNWVSVNSTATTWTLDSINWSNQPLSILFQGAWKIDKVNNWFSYNCTRSVTAASTKLSICIALMSGDKVKGADQYNQPYIADGVVFFYSSDSANSPKLEVTYDKQSSVPEFPAITVLPLLISMLFIAVILRHRKTINQCK